MAAYEDFITALTEEQMAKLDATFTEQVPREDRLHELAEKIKNQGAALVLGAGVSRAAGVPSRSTLVTSLLVAQLSESVGATEPIEALSESYHAALPRSPLAMARCVQSKLGSDAFNEAVRLALYRHAEAAKDSRLLMALARLCRVRENECGGVQEVITYNFDDLFESALNEAGRAHTVTTKNQFPKSANLPLQHVHGKLPQSPGEDDWSVFSEHEHREQCADPYSWSNLVQLNAFGKHCCVFVGMSLEEPNLRRLLNEVSRLRGAAVDAPHYAFLRATDADSVMADVERNLFYRERDKGRPSGRDLADVARRSKWMCRLADFSREKMLLELGVKVVWYPRHADLPSLLERVDRAVG